MLFILTSLTNFPSTPAKYRCLFVLFASTVELKTWECRDREATEGPGTGQINREVLWSGIFKQSTLDTMTPPCSIRYVCTHATICPAIPGLAQASTARSRLCPSSLLERIRIYCNIHLIQFSNMQQVFMAHYTLCDPSMS